MSRPEDVEALFKAALARPPEVRRAFLADAAVDPAVRAEVASLLEAHERRGRLDSLMDQTAPDRDDSPAGITSRVRAALGDRYVVDRELGRGGMAVVYLADDLKHRRRVAVKVLKPELVPALGTERFLREIQIAAGLAHPHILPLYDSGEANGLLYYVMPYVEGETLRARLQRERQLPVEEAVHITTQVAEALGYAHSLGLIHRDIKPENLLFQAGQAVVSDFGIARAVSQAGGDHLTQSGIAVGTLGYMSPEQAAGKKDLDGRSDLYSLACVLYEMLAGETPLGPASGAAAVEGPAAELRAARGSISLPLATVIARALARTPADRFATGAQFNEALLAAQASRPITTTPGAGRRWISGAVASALLTTAMVWYLGTARHGGSPVRPAGIRLAVLPFENLTGDPGQEYFSDGLTEEMITELGRLNPSTLGVIARTSAMRYKKTDKPLDQVGRELGVDYVLEGSARREGRRVRIAVRLIRSRDQTELWADSYERDLSSILTMQTAVAQGVALSLKVALVPGEQARAATSRAVDPEAYESYLQGKFYSNKLSGPDLDAGLHYFQAALRRDPGFALAHSGVAMVWLAREQLGLASPPDANPKAVAAAMTALRLDSTLTEGHYVLALIRSQERRWQTADSEMQRALALNPGFPDTRAFYSHLLNFLGRTADARAQIDQAVATDPLNPLFLSLDAVDYLYDRRPDRAIDQGLKALKAAPETFVALNALWLAFEEQRKYAEAAGFAARYLRSVGQDSAGAAVERAYRTGGYQAAMRAGADALVAHAKTGYVTPTDVAQLAMAAGDSERVFEWLERGLREGDPNMPYLDIMFRSLSNDPRLAELRRRLDLPDRT